MIVQSVIRLFVCIYLLIVGERNLNCTYKLSFVTPNSHHFWIPLALRTWVHAALSSSSTAYCVCIFFGLKRAQCMPKHPLSLDARKQGGRIAISLDLALPKIFHLLYNTRIYTYMLIVFIS